VLGLEACFVFIIPKMKAMQAHRQCESSSKRCTAPAVRWDSNSRFLKRKPNKSIINFMKKRIPRELKIDEKDALALLFGFCTLLWGPFLRKSWQECNCVMTRIRENFFLKLTKFDQMTYNLRSMVVGIGAISVPNSFSIRYKL
jgi:hypothetical protein